MTGEFDIASAEDMRALGEQIAGQLLVGRVLLLNGDLGAGKTTLSQGIARGLGVITPVTSPTFTLVAEHIVPEGASGIRRLYHLDLYRLNNAAELETIGYDDYLAPVDGISLIEWPERAGDWLPDQALLIDIVHAGEGKRRITIRCWPEE